MSSNRSPIFKQIFLLISIFLIALIVGCAPVTPGGASAVDEGAPAEAQEKILVVASSIQYGESFDVFTMATSDTPHSMIYESLVAIDTNYQFQPGLAERWEVSEDGQTTTFYLKKGVKFHDGSDFNAEVVKWWAEGMLDCVSSYL